MTAVSTSNPNNFKENDSFSVGDFSFTESTRIDLHSHTSCSDGGLTPQELIDRAVNFQLDVLAITDHDTVSALTLAHDYIKDKNYPLKLINGIEISTQWQGFEIHIVGLNIDPNQQALTELITQQQALREQRAVTMGEKLTKCGFANVYQAAKGLAGEGSITRAHFAKVLFQQGHVATMQKAFDKYIGKGKRAYVNPNWCSIEGAVEVIHAAGGSAVMAHPIRYDLSAKWLRRLIVQFKADGGDALEIVLPQMAPQQRELMLNYCLEYNLQASMGSDFHYPSKWSDLGRNLRLPEKANPVWALWH
ncbi:MAG: PHP domain-containing protein [Alteromonadaceae bacterium]|nr:PHP domain-containing protein [Alteromonadaceae bacterium]